MGCRTGFYMSVIGTPDEKRVGEAWTKAMKDVLKVEKMEDIPELNVYQCGTYTLHSLDEAKSIAKHILDSGIGVMRNEDLALGEDKLRELGNAV